MIGNGVMHKMKEFIDRGLIEGKYSGGEKYKRFICPCCGHETTFYEWLGNSEYNYGDDYPNKPYRKCFQHFMMHLRAKIRLSGDEKHIRLLIELFGEKEACEILEKMAKKNMIVALRLSNVVKELKRGIINENNSGR